MKTANLAIVFTHIEGFGERAGRQTLEENERLLKTHTALLSPLFRAFGGRIVKSIDDALLVTFESPTRAVLAAVAAQDRLWQHNRAALPAERFELRIAINVGEVRLEDDDVFGEPVNIAARVEGIAQPGEVYFTEAVYLAMNKAEVPAQEVGAFELKGIPGRVTVFKVPRAPYRVEAPATASLAGDEGPPFGNLGLSRLPEDAGRNQLGAYAAAVVDKAATMLATRRRPVFPLVAGAGALLVAIAIAVAAMGSEVQSAIDAVAKSPESERQKKVEVARRLIGRIEDEGERAYWGGRLNEALGQPADAIADYREASRRKNEEAVARLIELLEHQKCSIRASAALALGDAQVKSARRALERLAKEGGPNENQDHLLGRLLGCSSKDAARRALERLE